MEEMAMAKTGKGLRRREALGLLAAGATSGVFGFPNIVRAAGDQPIKVGMPTILSGRFSLLGSQSKEGASLVLDSINAAGGIDGRKLELVARDSKGRPDEAAKTVRAMINDGCEVFLAAEASSGTFAIQELIRESGHLCIHTNSETSSLTADPKIRAPTAFRATRQGIHDSIWGAKFVADIAKEQNLKKWMNCSPDFAYGRDTSGQFFEQLGQFAPDAKVIGESWPKFMAPDFTENITKISSLNPDALYSAHSGGDLIAFLDQATIYGLFDKMRFFTPNLAEIPILDEVKALPAGSYSGSRYVPSVPDSKENVAFFEAYKKANNRAPGNWSWENYVGAQFLVAALKATKSTDGKKLADALRGLTIDSPFGTNGKITMRAEDQTTINYAIGWGEASKAAPYLIKPILADWNLILEREAAWKKKMGYTG
jgi:branched-chain amino acid transport system substrate-binding protein